LKPAPITEKLPKRQGKKDYQPPAYDYQTVPEKF